MRLSVKYNEGIIMSKSQKEIIISPRAIAKEGHRYVINIPSHIGKALYGKLLKVTLEVIDLKEF